MPEKRKRVLGVEIGDLQRQRCELMHRTNRTRFGILVCAWHCPKLELWGCRCLGQEWPAAVNCGAHEDADAEADADAAAGGRGGSTPSAAAPPSSASSASSPLPSPSSAP